MKAGTSETSTNKPKTNPLTGKEIDPFAAYGEEMGANPDGLKAEPKQQVNDTFEKLSDFFAKHAAAKSQRKKFVETTRQVMKELFPNGLGTKPYALYQDLFIVEYGKLDVLEADLNIDLQRQLHGEDECPVERPRVSLT